MSKPIASSQNAVQNVVGSPNWVAVFALALCAATLVASEFLPISLLTPIATELQLTEGQTGRAITVSGFFAVLTSLNISSLTRGVNRRLLLLCLVGLLVVGNVVVILAPSVVVFMVGRAFIGVVVGGFWSMSAATVMRLVSVADVPKGLAVVNGGTALASAIAAPLGSYLGQFIGWRKTIFFLMVPLGVLALFGLLMRLPSLPSQQVSGGSIFRLLGQRPVALGMLAVMLFFLGQFSMSTYLRSFLETGPRVTTTTISLIQFVMGCMGFLGSTLIGMQRQVRLYRFLILIPLLMACIVAALTAVGVPVVAAALLAAWGFLATAAPAAWWIWLSRALPQNAEAGGGLMVAVIQLAITFGAALSGFLYDQGGYRSSFLFSALMLCLAAFLALLIWRTKKS